MTQCNPKAKMNMAGLFDGLAAHLSEHQAWPLCCQQCHINLKRAAASRLETLHKQQQIKPQQNKDADNQYTPTAAEHPHYHVRLRAIAWMVAI